MTIAEFVAKWRKVELTERSASQQHFLDLCEVLGHPKPALADPAGEWFTFEKGAAKQGGGKGWADVWKRGFFGWEYKGKHKNLDAAYDQLLQYREALESPPLLVVCDMERIVIHTNFTATASKVYEIPLNELDTPRNIEIMRWLFHEPLKLRPDAASAAQLAKRTLTNLYNARPTWLDLAHRRLDEAACAAYGWDPSIMDEEILSRLLTLNRQRAT